MSTIDLAIRVETGQNTLSGENAKKYRQAGTFFNRSKDSELQKHYFPILLMQFKKANYIKENPNN